MRSHRNSFGGAGVHPRGLSIKVVDRAAILLSTPIFRDLTRETVGELLPHLRQRDYAAGQVVWFEGDPIDALYVIVEGTLKSHRTSPEGGEVIVALNSAIDVTGEVGLFHPSGVRQVNVSALTAARCLTLRRDHLVAFMSQHPPAMLRVLERVSTMAVKAVTSFSGVAFDDIRRRVVGALLTLAAEFGEPDGDGDGIRIRLQLSQSTLASLVAASRENVNRALSGLVGAGLVSHRDGYFHIHDAAALEEVLADR